MTRLNEGASLALEHIVWTAASSPEFWAKGGRAEPFRTKNAPDSVRGVPICKTTENEISERQKKTCRWVNRRHCRSGCGAWSGGFPAGRHSLSRISSILNMTRMRAGVSPEPALALRQRQTALFPKWFAIYQLCVSERQDKGSGGKHPADFRMAVLQKGKRTPRRYCPAGLGFSPRSEWSSSRGPSAHPSWGYLRAEHRSRKRP